MRLRDHPIIAGKWPPAWTFIGGTRGKDPAGEDGTLARVVRSPAAANLVFLVIDHHEAQYIGSMSFDDPAFCEDIYIALRMSIGWTIAEIGSKDLTPFL
jgi:hypothetical protein